jgi:hypothetical protein
VCVRVCVCECGGGTALSHLNVHQHQTHAHREDGVVHDHFHMLVLLVERIGGAQEAGAKRVRTG